MDIIKGDTKKARTQKDVPETATISYPKTPNNTKTSNNTQRQLKAPENNSRWRYLRRVEYGEERKISGNSVKNGENRNSTED